jgi:hypothetical protein
MIVFLGSEQREVYKNCWFSKSHTRVHKRTEEKEKSCIVKELPSFWPKTSATGKLYPYFFSQNPLMSKALEKACAPLKVLSQIRKCSGGAQDARFPVVETIRATKHVVDGTSTRI